MSKKDNKTCSKICDNECCVVAARVVQGHRVASGENGDPRYPGGTIRMQQPYFKALGLDLFGFYHGTVNVDIAPSASRRRAPCQVAWHPTTAEIFPSLCRGARSGEAGEGLHRLPHPDIQALPFQAVRTALFIPPCATVV